MKTPRLELRPLQVSDEASFKAAVREYEAEAPSQAFAFDFDPNADFTAYVRKLERWSQGLDLPERFVPNTFFVGVVDGVIVGRLSLRHRLNAFLKQIGGHLGYSVIPSQRRRGYASEMLRQGLFHCVRLGIARVLVTCDEDNVGSRKVIEKCGGQFDRIVDNPEENKPLRHYWITITADDSAPSCPAPS